MLRLQHAITALLLLAAAREASASSFVPSDEVTYSGTSAVATSLNPSFGIIAPTVSYGISNAFNGAPIAADFPSGVATGNGGPWNFYDDYTFTVGAGGSIIQSALIAFNTTFSGINNLQGRIIGVTGTFNAAGNLGAPASGNTLIDSWVNTSPVAGINTVNLNSTTFGPGTYDLQIRGEVLGTPPTGGYGGSITFTPVPLPAALPLLLSGLGLFAMMRRKQRLTAMVILA
jgi:hypothetical protein